MAHADAVRLVRSQRRVSYPEPRLWILLGGALQPALRHQLDGFPQRLDGSLVLPILTLELHVCREDAGQTPGSPRLPITGDPSANCLIQVCSMSNLSKRFARSGACNPAFVLIRSGPNRSLISISSGQGSAAFASSLSMGSFQKARDESSPHSATKDAASLISPGRIWEPNSSGRGNLADALYVPGGSSPLGSRRVSRRRGISRLRSPTRSKLWRSSGQSEAEWGERSYAS